MTLAIHGPEDWMRQLSSADMIVVGQAGQTGQGLVRMVRCGEGREPIPGKELTNRQEHGWCCGHLGVL